MSCMLQRLVLVLCIVGVALGATSVRADPRDEPTNPVARAHFDQGGKLFGLKEFERAIDEYKQGALIESRPVWDLALGQCYRMLHKFDDALWHFDRFIKYGHPTGNVLKGMNDLIALVKADRADREKATTQERAEATPAVTPERKPAVSSGSPASSVQPPMVTIVEPGEPWYRDGIGLGLGGVGTIAIGVAGYLVLDAHRLQDASRTEPTATGSAELHDQAGSRYKLGAAVGIGGVGLLVAGGIKLASGSHDRIHHGYTSWNVGIAVDGIMVFGRF